MGQSPLNLVTKEKSSSLKSITPSIALSMINRHAIVTLMATRIDDELGVTKLVNFSVVVVVWGFTRMLGVLISSLVPGMSRAATMLFCR